MDSTFVIGHLGIGHWSLGIGHWVLEVEVAEALEATGYWVIGYVEVAEALEATGY